MMLCPVSNKCFIGSARSIIRRWYTHTYELKNQNHEIEDLQKMYQKYGREAVVFFVLENCTKDYLAKKLEAWAELLDKEYSLQIKKGAV